MGRPARPDVGVGASAGLSRPERVGDVRTSGGRLHAVTGSLRIARELAWNAPQLQVVAPASPRRFRMAASRPPRPAGPHGPKKTFQISPRFPLEFGRASIYTSVQYRHGCWPDGSCLDDPRAADTTRDRGL